VPLPAAYVRQVGLSVAALMASTVQRAVEHLDAPSKLQRIDASYGPVAMVLQLLRHRREEIESLVGAALREQIERHAADAGYAQASRSDGDGDDHRMAAWSDPASAKRPVRSPNLTLISESQIDTEIETARIVQLIDSGCEAELVDLAGLCSGLLRRPVVDAAVVPLRPSACAFALREGVNRVTQDAALRPALLRVLGWAMGEQMREVYAAQVEWLRRHGVRPTAFLVRAAPGEGGQAGPSGPAQTLETAQGLPGGQVPRPPEESMRELVHWARQVSPESPPGPELLNDDEPAAGDVELRLFGVPIRFGSGGVSGDEPLPRAASEQLMGQLFGELRRQADASPAMGGLLRRVELVAQRVAMVEPALWSDPQHPWWQLLDRLLAIAAMRDDLRPADQQVLLQALGSWVEQMEAQPSIDGAAGLAAADDLRALAARLLENAAEPPPDEVDEIQRLADREELELTFRGQIVQQLRSTPSSGVMKRFLVGPWVLTLVALAQQHGPDSAQVAAAALVVDDLIRATAQPGQPASREQRHLLLRQVREGLKRAALPAPRIDAELAELADILRTPPPHPENPQEIWEEEPIAPLPVPFTLDLHAGLPTVPLALQHDGGASSAQPRATSSQWAAALQPGACCRLFLQGQWMTTRLHWVGPGQRLFMFQSRHGGRSHSLTQRMLQKLRDAGLATSIEDSQLRAIAMDSLVRNTMI
jgi:hypothetical protein